MKHTLLLSILTLSLLSFNSEKKFALDDWDAATLEKANTAKDVESYSEEEKQVVFYMNLARLNPVLFAKTHYADYLEKNKIKPSSQTRSLQIDLTTRTKAMDVLTVKEDLSEEAKNHAEDSGNAGKMGHFTSDNQSFAVRVKKFKGVYAGVAENCDYGNDKALDIVMSLLIDETEPQVLHRKNILNPKHKYTGVSIHSHKKSKWTCVIDFAL